MNYKKIALAVSLLALFGLTLNFSAQTAQAVTVAELQRQIQQILEQINQLQRQLGMLQDRAPAHTPPTPANRAPYVNPGTTHTINVGQQYTHSRAWAFDADNNLSRYSWSWLSCPGTCPSLSGNVSGTLTGGNPSVWIPQGPTFTPITSGHHDLLLTVTEATGVSHNSVVRLTAIARPTGERLPDLTVTRLKIYRIDPNRVGIDYCIKNIGDVDARRFSTQFHNLDHPGSNPGSAGFDDLVPNEEWCGERTYSGVATAGGSVFIAGQNRIRLVVDSAGEVREGNERNNERTVVFDTRTGGEAIRGTDLEMRNLTKGDFHPYGFFYEFCMHGPKSINDLRRENPSLRFVPVAYHVHDVHGWRHRGDASCSGDCENIKNGQCAKVGWIIDQPSEQFFYRQTRRVDIVLDPDNLILETNEQNNKASL